MTSLDQRRPVPVLQGTHVRLRPGRQGDEDALAAVFDSPEVTTWWPRPTPSEIAELVANADPESA